MTEPMAHSAENDAPWLVTPEERARRVPHVADCDDEGCYCPDDVFWARLLGDADPCAPGKDWAASAFTHPEGIDL